MTLLATMDLTNAEILSEKPIILPGKYTIKVIKADLTQTKNGNNQLVIVFANIDKQTITEYYNLDSTNAFAKNKMFTLLTALGNDMTKFNGKITTDMLINRKVDATIKRKYNDYNGKWYSNIHQVEMHNNVILNNPNISEINEMQKEKQSAHKDNNFSFNSNDQDNDYMQNLNNNSFDDFPL